jgi:hypothetical protein
MAESNKQVRISDPYDRFDEAINDPELYPAYQYEARPEARQLEPLPQDRVPLFLSDYDQQQYEDERYDDEGPEYTFGSKQQKPRTSYVVTGVLAATTIAAVVGLFSIDATRSVIVNAKASLASLAPSSLGGSPSEAAPPPAQPPLRVASAVAPEPRIAAPEAQAVYRSRPEPAAAPEPAPAPVAAAPAPSKPKEAYAWQPSRNEISSAYQNAIKGQQQQMAAVAPAAVAPAAAPLPQSATPGTRRIDADEVAGILKRAKTLLAMGDIFAARLLLERAADIEGEAALMLGTTYDPAVVGNHDMRSITPDPAMARQWYQRAAELGSSDARRRLSQLQN